MGAELSFIVETSAQWIPRDIEIAPQRIGNRQSSAEEPVTAMIRRKAEEADDTDDEDVAAGRLQRTGPKENATWRTEESDRCINT